MPGGYDQVAVVKDRNQMDFRDISIIGALAL
jgi:hypothetical protein